MWAAFITMDGKLCSFNIQFSRALAFLYAALDPVLLNHVTLMFTVQMKGPIGLRFKDCYGNCNIYRLTG